jgi:hypothetical protein
MNTLQLSEEDLKLIIRLMVPEARYGDLEINDLCLTNESGLKINWQYESD